MMASYDILFIISNVISIVGQIIILIGAFLYLYKKKSAAGWIMIISGILSLFISIGRPLLFEVLESQFLENNDIIMAQAGFSIIGTLLYIVFAIGFIWAVVGLKKNS